MAGMDPSLLKLVRKFTPPVNMNIIDGLAVEHMRHAEQFMEDIFRTVAKDFPPSLKFIGGDRCSPYEEFTDEPRSKAAGRPTVDIAESHIYMMKYRFSFEGEELPPRYIFLPYVGEAGSLMLSGARFFISPMLSDVVLSYERDKIFVVITRDKFAINRAPHSLIIDGEREEVIISWSIIHNDPKAKSKSRDQRKIPLLHYLLGKYGFTETFKRFGQCDPVLGRDEINEANYPKDKWIIAESTRMMPRPFTGGSPLRMAIPRAQYTPMIRTMVAAFYYIADRFGTQLSPEFKDNLRMWKTFMGITLWGDAKGSEVVYEEVVNHFNSLDKYIDDMVKPRLARIGYPCNDLYEFLAICIKNMDQWMVDTPKKSISLYEKELSILYPVFLEFIKAIFKFYFAIDTEEKKNGLSKKSVLKILNDSIKPRLVFKIRTAASNVASMSYSGDNKFFKLTSVMKPQKGGHGKDSKNESAVRMHTSIPAVGSMVALPKVDPTGWARVNPHLMLENMAFVKRDPVTRDMLDGIQEILDRTMRTVVKGLDDGIDMRDLQAIGGDSD